MAEDVTHGALDIALATLADFAWGVVEPGEDDVEVIAAAREVLGAYETQSRLIGELARALGDEHAAHAHLLGELGRNTGRIVDGKLDCLVCRLLTRPEVARYLQEPSDE